MDDGLGLSVTGVSSARHNRPLSGQSRRPGSAYAQQSTKSHIFGIPDTPKRSPSHGRPPSGKPPKPSSTGSKYSTPEAPRGTPPKNITSTHKKHATQQENAAREPAHTPGRNAEFRSQSRGRKAPPGVPVLNLGSLADNDDELRQPLSKHQPTVITPDSKSSVSWGTPTKLKQAPNKMVNEERNWKIHDYNHPKSESRRKPQGMPELNLQLSQSGDDQLKKALHIYNEQNNEQTHAEEKAKYEEPEESEQKTASTIPEPTNFALAEENRNKMRSTGGLPGTYPEHAYNQPFYALPATEKQHIQKHVLEEQDKMQTTWKKQVVEDTVLVDNLSRAAISEPTSTTPAPTLDEPKIAPKDRRHMELYNTRNKPSNAENLLSKRLRFSGRIMTNQGRDVHRELNGFFFLGDSSLTLYEFRQFGARSSALPFIQRGNYCHICGRKQGQPYSLLDIHVGSALTFETKQQASLPDTLKAKSVLTVKICDMDEEMRQNLLYDNCKSYADRSTVNKSVEQSQGEEEAEKQKIDKLQASIRNQVRKRGVRTLTGLGKHFRKLDKSGDGVLNTEEFQEALRLYHIQVNHQDFERLWGLMDYNGDGVLDYGEFMHGMFGEMNEVRKQILRKVFFKLDPNKTGVMKFSDVMKFFIAHRHPKVLTGELRESDVVSELRSSFQDCEKQDEVKYAELEEYYEGVSLGNERDQEFVQMMRNCWGI